jgi:hypothetical protein
MFFVGDMVDLCFLDGRGRCSGHLLAWRIVHRSSFTLYSYGGTREPACCRPAMVVQQTMVFFVSGGSRGINSNVFIRDYFPGWETRCHQSV